MGAVHYIGCLCRNHIHPSNPSSVAATCAELCCAARQRVPVCLTPSHHPLLPLGNARTSFIMIVVVSWKPPHRNCLCAMVVVGQPMPSSTRTKTGTRRHQQRPASRITRRCLCPFQVSTSRARMWRRCGPCARGLTVSGVLPWMVVVANGGLTCAVAPESPSTTLASRRPTTAVARWRPGCATPAPLIKLPRRCTMPRSCFLPRCPTVRTGWRSRRSTWWATPASCAPHYG